MTETNRSDRTTGSALTIARGYAGVRLLLAAVIAAAVIAQLVDLLGRTTPGKTGNFFSYFTIQSNLIVAIVLAVSAAMMWRGRSPRWVELARGAATVYISITGVVYSLLLSGVDVDTALPWVNVVLHYVIPVLMVIDWLLDLPVRAIGFRSAIWWLAYPLLYLGYSLVRGPIVDWYPYPFIDPRHDGYGHVAIMSVFVAIAAAVFVVMVAGATRLPGRTVRWDD